MREGECVGEKKTNLFCDSLVTVQSVWYPPCRFSIPVYTMLPGATAMLLVHSFCMASLASGPCGREGERGFL